MNRFAAAGLVLDVLESVPRPRHVLVVGRQPRTSLDEVRRFASEHVPDLIGKVRTANGSERITFTNGGRIEFVASTWGMRGRSADVVYLDSTDGLSDAVIESARAVIATSSVGEIVRP
jgi:hypothetical protein